MTSDPQNPRADHDEKHMGRHAGADEFYVVGLKKFYQLYFCTLGLYLVFWFYENWRLYRARHGLQIFPALRAVFPIFFTHALFMSIDRSLIKKGYDFHWSASGLATFFVGLSVLDAVLRFAAYHEVMIGLMTIGYLLIMLIVAVVIARAQRAINILHEDELGESNQRLTFINVGWCMLGGYLWLSVLVGLLNIMGIISVTPQGL